MISVFTQTADGFSSDASQLIEVPPEHIVFDFAPSLPGSRAPHLLFLHADGVSARPFIDGSLSDRVVHLVASSSVFPAADPTALPLWDLYREQDMDTRASLLIPKPNRLEIFTSEREGNFKSAGVYDIQMDVAINGVFANSSHNHHLTSSVQLYKIIFEDFNGDGLEDMAIARRDKVDVYYAERSGMPEKYAPKKPDAQIYFGVTTRDERINGINAALNIDCRVADINNDGYADILLSKTDKSEILSSLGQIQVFFNEGGRFRLIPDCVFTIKNYNGEYELVDLNNDDLADIVFTSSTLNIATMAKLLLTRKLEFNCSFYMQREGGTFPIERDEWLRFFHTIDLDRILAASPIFTLSGDYNGDGAHDLLIESALDEIVIYWGRQNQRYSKKARSHFATNPSRFFRVLELNDDQKSDILFWNYIEKSFESRINVLFGRKHP